MASSETGLPNSWARGSLWGMTKCVQVITFIGAGGKTTCLRALTQEIVSAGQRVIATTTTKVFPEETMNSWRNPNPPPFEQEGACFWYVNVIEENGKWIGPRLKAVDKAIGRARADLNVGIQELLLNVSASTNVNTSKSMSMRGQRTVPELHDLYWVVEGDGARGLKLKCWESHEPQIPQLSDCVVLVLDGGLWGRVLLAEQVHRPAGCLDLIGQVWNAEKAWRYFLRSPLFAPQYGHMSWVILLNIQSRNSDNGDLVKTLEPLHDLKHRWAEIEREVRDQEYRPKHLRIAAGDAKEGKLLWFDLW
ncbi:conserved hypothetical protein [Candidatus Desulfosporosinus infrequens]|uniref:Selenium-dependent hydroxylase accessory protein YqeC n=1 Tax=Candidatus Desulfosporosinus infrequens TaxID=2043169 RepID=A0A2U3LMF3_9FIRM|nr:conserved hypothetical protein [Candidatus Desulfosporosinus infrequens]